MGEKKTNNRKLILFIHGLGGSEETWGKFPSLIEESDDFKSFDIALYNYRTSLIRPKSLVSIFSKIASLFTPQKKLPSIQDVADMLKTELEIRYKQYDEIYMMTHSMGGLVARQYIFDMLEANNALKVKKLMLYAVPHNGSDWAKLEPLYKHEQIAELNRDSLFMKNLNRKNQNHTLEDVLKVRYVIGKYDEVVDEGSARSYWGHTNCDSLAKGHIDIVKPENAEDMSFLVFQEFMLKDGVQEIEKESENVALSQEAKASPFIKEVFDSLFTIKPLMVLYYQEFTTITKEKNYLKEQAFHTFKNNMYEIVIPSYKDEKAYFSYLAKVCGMSNLIDSADQWRDAFDARLKNKERFLLLVSEVDEGERELNKLFANAIRALQTSYANLFVLFIGRKKLAYMVHGENELSPLNGAVELFFSNRERYLPKEKALAILNECKEDCDLLCTDIGVEWSVYPNTKVIRKLFWKNLLKKEENTFVWYDKATEALAKNCCGCEDVV